MFDTTAPMASSKGISDRLNTLRQARPEVETAILLDFRAGTVLSVCSSVTQKQETLDGIVATCARLLDGLLGRRDHFVLATHTELIVAFLAGGDTALALVLDPREDPEQAKGIAREMLKALDR